MNDKDSYEDKVLLKLRRTYSKDETVAALSKKLSEAEVKIGQLKSELQHLQYQNKLSNDKLKTKLANKANDLYGKLLGKYKKLEKSNENLIKRNAELERDYQNIFSAYKELIKE